MAGSGTSNDPWQITHASDLQNLSYIVSINQPYFTAGIYFKLMNDIDMQGITWIPIGYHIPPNVPNSFQGHFDGNGKIIRNLTCKNYIGGGHPSGFFYTLYNATVMNLGIENCDMESVSSVGGLALAASYSDISNCYVIGNIKAGKGAGGLVGGASCTYISNCYFSGNINIVGTGGYHVGGLVGTYSDICIGGDGGSGYQSFISNCYVIGRVSVVDAYAYFPYGYVVGGLVGTIDGGAIRNCVVALDSLTLNIIGTYFNRIVGYNHNAGGTLQNNYALNTMVVQDGNGNVPIISHLDSMSGLSISMDSLQSFAFYNRASNWYQMPWNIAPPSGIWKICDGQDLPFLRWQGIDCYFDITVTADSNGSITPSGTVKVVDTINQTFIFTPNTCYEIDSLWIDGVYEPDSIAAGSYTFYNVTKNHSIKVSFKKIDYFSTF